MDKLNIV